MLFLLFFNCATKETEEELDCCATSNTTPRATDVNFTGTLKIKETLTATYNWTDTDAGDKETNSVLKWYRSTDNNGANKTVISGASTKSYILKTEDGGKYISFEVTPNDGKNTGRTVESNLLGPVKNEQNIDPNCLDISNYPEISEFLKAGVVGGIPNSLQIATTLDTGADIQSAINTTSQNGGGIVLLNPGTYPITSTLYLKKNVVLKGANQQSVILESTIRSTWSQGKKNTVEFNNVTNAGIENLTILYKVDGIDPVDRLNWKDGGWCGDCFGNDPQGQNNLYVRQISINSNSSNCWVDGCKILKSGTDPILLAGSHNTLQNNFIDRCYNKGGGGNGYYDVRGSYNLIKKDTIKRLRHFAIQQGAKYNVVLNCYIEGDVNFHNKDAGNNLLENNKIFLPTWHGWDIFGTGGAQYGHKPPGPKNILFNNITNYKNREVRYAKTDVIYTFTTYGAPEETLWNKPACGTFYPTE